MNDDTPLGNGQESLEDYPGPDGLLRQINAGLKIAHLEAKLEKAKKQVAENHANAHKLKLSMQKDIAQLDHTMRDFYAVGAELVKTHRRIHRGRF